MDNKKDYYVVKSNDFIRNSKTNLTVKQQHLILYVLSQIIPGSDILEFTFSIKDYLYIFNASGGSAFRKVKSDLEKIQNECYWYINGNETVRLPIFKSVHITNQSGMVTVMLNPYLKPHFYHQNSNYTQFLLSMTSTLRHKHSIELYEYFKSYEYAQNITKLTVTKSLNDIKFKLNMLEKSAYSSFTEFNRRILKDAVKEINSKTDIYVTLTPIRKGRCVTHLKIDVKSQNK